jgi:hypothetical protein
MISEEDPSKPLSANKQERSDDDEDCSSEEADHFM